MYDEEQVPSEEGESGDEEAAAMEELAGAAQGAGIEPGTLDATMENGNGELSPEDLALLNELQAQGITLEDIATLLESQGQEGGLTDPEAVSEEELVEQAMGGEGDIAAAEAMAEQMPQDSVDAAVQGADDITKAASILGIAPQDLFNTLFKKA